MADCIYLIQSDGKSLAMKPKAYDSEDEFQSLLERYPELLAGEQIDPENPRQWLLLGREVGISDREDGGARWSLDHLFVDQDGIPTLVEVKRQSDPRLRREVVGQVLDYAANARFWTSGFLASLFDETCRKQGRDPTQVLGGFLGSTQLEADGFWGHVERRLRDGDMRLVFFADVVPNELQRVVEFLNEGLSNTEVLAVEVRRYAAEGFTTHVPRVIGVTADAQATKATARPGKNWTEATFFEAASALPQDAQRAIRSLLDAARECRFDVRWGKGATSGTFNIVLPAPCGRAMLTVVSTGKLWLNRVWMYGSEQAEHASRVLLELAQHFGVSEQYLKQPSVGHEVWVPELALVLNAVRALRSVSRAS